MKIILASKSGVRKEILDKYNIWEQIYQIINNRDNFEENYRVIK